MRAYVEVHTTTSDGKDNTAGDVYWDGQTFGTDPADNSTLIAVLSQPIEMVVGGQMKKVTSDDGPDFLWGLHQNYRSPYLWCAPARFEGLESGTWRLNMIADILGGVFGQEGFDNFLKSVAQVTEGLVLEEGKSGIFRDKRGHRYRLENGKRVSIGEKEEMPNFADEPKEPTVVLAPAASDVAAHASALSTGALPRDSEHAAVLTKSLVTTSPEGLQEIHATVGVSTPRKVRNFIINRIKQWASLKGLLVAGGIAATYGTMLGVEYAMNHPGTMDKVFHQLGDAIANAPSDVGKAGKMIASAADLAFNPPSSTEVFGVDEVPHWFRKGIKKGNEFFRGKKKKADEAQNPAPTKNPLREAFTGTIVDVLGRKYHYVNGKRVASQSDLHHYAMDYETGTMADYPYLKITSHLPTGEEADRHVSLLPEGDPHVRAHVFEQGVVALRRALLRKLEQPSEQHSAEEPPDVKTAEDQLWWSLDGMSDGDFRSIKHRFGVGDNEDVDGPTELIEFIRKQAQQEAQHKFNRRSQGFNEGIGNTTTKFYEAVLEENFTGVKDIHVNGRVYQMRFEDGHPVPLNPVDLQSHLQKAAAAPPVEQPKEEFRGPSRLDQRKDAQPPTLEFKAPPKPRGKAGERKGGGYAANGVSNTMLGDLGEAITEQLGLRNILPPGRRNSVTTKKFGSTLDREFDHSGIAFEVKTVSVLSTHYKARPKKSEVRNKLRFAKLHQLKPATMIVVMDTDKGKAHAYWRMGLGAFRLTPGNYSKWNYAGTVKVGTAEK